MKKLALLVFFVFLSLRGLPAQSVGTLLQAGTQTAQETTSAATDPLGRDTPAGTVLGFLQSAQNGGYKTAADYLQLTPAHRQSQALP